METTTITFDAGSDKKATLVIGSENGKVKTIGDINYSPALDATKEAPSYAKLAQLLRKKLVD